MAADWELVKQEGINLINTKKKVDWLVDHTYVRVFDPITFEGYQRQIDESHRDKLVAYLNKPGLLLPTPIICATDEQYSDSTEKLFIVDGQHRIEAFKRLREINPERYNVITEMELPVIILDNVEEKKEIETFITINKKAKKVDTSLALVLLNKINNDSSDLTIPKRDYIAVEVARALNGDGGSAVISDLWNDKIRYEGTTKNTYQLISLNAFVKSMRSLLSVLERKGLFDLHWKNEAEIIDKVTTLAGDIDIIWCEIRGKWPEVFDGGLDQRRIIQGSIGFTAINRYLSLRIKEKEYSNSFVENAIEWIREIRKESSVWLPGGKYSEYSSERGFTLIAADLLNSCR